MANSRGLLDRLRLGIPGQLERLAAVAGESGLVFRHGRPATGEMKMKTVRFLMLIGRVGIMVFASGIVYADDFFVYPQGGAVNRNNYDRAYKACLEEGFWLFEAGSRQ